MSRILPHGLSISMMDRLDLFADSIIDDRKNLIVPSIVLYEVQKWLSLYQSVDAARTAGSIMMRNKIVLLDPTIAFEASQLSIKYKLAMADAIIYATTLAHAAELWTTDSHFKGLPNVRYFEKE